MIAKRFKSVLDESFDKEQTGFLKGRFIGENTRLIYDIMNFAIQNDIPGLLALIEHLIPCIQNVLNHKI